MVLLIITCLHPYETITENTDLLDLRQYLLDIEKKTGKALQTTLAIKSKFILFKHTNTVTAIQICMA